MKSLRFFVLLQACFFLAGCGLSLNTSRNENPVIQDYSVPSTFFSRSTNVFATKASHRLALIVDDGKYLTTCAEPSPDVGETFASALANTFSLEAKETKSQAEGKLSNDYRRAISTQIAPLLYRTQGLQLYRNAMNSLCIDRMNKNVNDGGSEITVPIESSVVITERIDPTTDKVIARDIQTNYDPQKTIKINTADYADLRYLYFIKAVEAIKAEIPQMIDAQKEYFKNVKPSGIDIETLQKIVEITSKSKEKDDPKNSNNQKNGNNSEGNSSSAEENK